MPQDGSKEVLLGPSNRPNTLGYAVGRLQDAVTAIEITYTSKNDSTASTTSYTRPLDASGVDQSFQSEVSATVANLDDHASTGASVSETPAAELSAGTSTGGELDEDAIYAAIAAARGELEVKK